MICSTKDQNLELTKITGDGIVLLVGARKGGNIVFCGCGRLLVNNNTLRSSMHKLKVKMSDNEIDEAELEVTEEMELNEEVGTGGSIKPFLKWAGGKFRVVDRLKKKFPKNAKRFIEPFLGAGSVSLNVDYPAYVVSDTCTDLICVWECFKEMGMNFVKECQELFIPENHTPERYYELRDELSKTKKKLRKATIFVYLNRHCFNGLCRYNASGGFNVPFGKYKTIYFPQKQFEQSLEQVKKFEIHNKDFREIFAMVEDGDLVYCDPPYLPMSQSASFDAYAKGGFSLRDQIDLAKCAEEAADNGATVVISNHYNWYSRQIYTDLHKGKVSKIEVARTISSKTDKRDAVDEIVAVFQKSKNVQSA